MRRAVLAVLAVVSVLASSVPIAAEGAGEKPSAQPVAQARRIDIKVTDAGFEPREIRVKKGEPVTLVFTRVTDRTCITAIDIPDEEVKKLELPLNRPAEVTITPKKPGVEAFHCSAMAMGNGRIHVE